MSAKIIKYGSREVKGLGGFTPLHIAAEYGHVAAMQALMECGAQLNAQSSIGQTALHHAASYGHLSAVDLLLNQGARVEGCADAYQDTPLTYAIVYGHRDIIKVLIAWGASVHHQAYKCTQLQIAVSKKIFPVRAEHQFDTQKQIEIMKVLLSAGARINECAKWQGNTALHVAAEEGNSEIAEVLIAYGADVDARNVSGFTPLIDCARCCDESEPCGHLQTMRILLNHGASVDMGDCADHTPLHYAAREQNGDAIDLLMQRSQSPIECVTKRGSTPLHCAIGAAWPDKLGGVPGIAPMGSSN